MAGGAGLSPEEEKRLARRRRRRMLRRVRIARDLMAEDRNAEAAAVLRTCVELFPDCHEAHADLGDALRQLEDLEGAADAYRAALALQPDNCWSWMGLGGMASDAQERFYCLRQALRVARSEGEYFRVGLALHYAGLLADAAEAYRAAAELLRGEAGPEVDDYFAFANLAQCLDELGDGDGAIAAYRSAVGLAPDEIDLRRALAERLEKSGRADEAEEHHRAVRELEQAAEGYRAAVHQLTARHLEPGDRERRE